MPHPGTQSSISETEFVSGNHGMMGPKETRRCTILHLTIKIKFEVSLEYI